MEIGSGSWVYILASVVVLSVCVAGCSDEDVNRETTSPERTFEFTEATSGVGAGHQAYQPSSRLVIPAADGTELDRIARVAGGMSEERLGTYTFVQQRPKDGGAAAWRDVADEEPDGHQMAYVTEGLLAADGVGPEDFELVARTDVGAAVLVVGGDAEAESFPLNVASLEDFVELAKEKPGIVRVADPGAGTVYRAGMLDLERRARIDVAPRTLERAPGEMFYDGDIEAALIPLEGDALTDIWAGELTPIAVFSEQRSEEIPDVPTAAEQGYDVNVPVFGGIAVPAGTPRSVVEELGRAFVRVSSSRTFSQALAGTGRMPAPLGPEEFTNYVEDREEDLNSSPQDAP